MIWLDISGVFEPYILIFEHKLSRNYLDALMLNASSYQVFESRWMSVELVCYAKIIIALQLLQLLL